ncbi:MAG: HIT family protein [Phycisphaerales bacterium JB052]
MTDTTTSPGPIAQRVQRILDRQDPQLIAEMPSGYAILGKYQPEPITGCCMLLPRLQGDGCVLPSPNDLDHEARGQFFSDLVLLGDAIMQVTGSQRINYLVLCNQVPELHGHCVPRFETEDPEKRKQGPFEAYDFGSARVADAHGQDQRLHTELRAALVRLLKNRG